MNVNGVQVFRTTSNPRTFGINFERKAKAPLKAGWNELVCYVAAGSNGHPTLSTAAAASASPATAAPIQRCVRCIAFSRTVFTNPQVATLRTPPIFQVGQASRLAAVGAGPTCA